MANQTELLNVSDEMKSDDERQNCVGQEHGEKLCFSSSDTTDELYSSTAPDTCRNSNFVVPKDTGCSNQHKFGLKISNLYITQVKQKYGIIERENYNKPKSENSRQPQCPSEKEAKN